VTNFYLLDEITGNVIVSGVAQKDNLPFGAIKGVAPKRPMISLSFDEIEAIRILDIKQKANLAILTIAPEWKQRNLIAQGLVFTEIVANGGTLTAEELATNDAIKSIWAQISAIRTASNQAELDGTLAINFNP